jgi:hypothetical protein
MVTTARYPVAPTTEPLVSRLLDVATVDSRGVELFTDTGLWESYNALTFGSAATICGANNKDLDQSTVWVDGFMMAAYGGVTCKAVGLDMAQQKAQVTRAFTQGASVAVETGLMDVRFADGGATHSWDAPTDIHPGGAVAPGLGIALLEAWMARRFVGQPILHLPTVVASLVLGVDGAVMEDNVIRTRLGSRIVNGAGYDEPNTGPTGAAAAAGQRWLYATGPVVIASGAIQPLQTFDQTTNDSIVLAEQVYIVAVEGPVAAIRVTVGD